jgi:hypothetical protein
MESYRTSVLDNGYVYLFSAAPDGERTKHILSKHYSGLFKSSILSVPRIVFSIKCPIAVIMSMTRLHLVADSSSSKISTFNPTVEHIRSGNLKNDSDISESIAMTNESLMLNQKAYTEDNCDRFVATLTTPISAYWEGLAYGDLSTWMEFSESKSAPRIVASYQDAIKNILTAEYGNIYSYGKGLYR